MNLQEQQAQQNKADSDRTYELNKTNSERNHLLALQAMAMNEDAQKIAKQQTMYNAIGNAIPAALATYGVGKDMGWWGKKNKDKDVTSTDIFNYTGNGSIYDTTGNDISNFDWTYGDEVPVNTGDNSSKSSSGNWDWLTDLFGGWF